MAEIGVVQLSPVYDGDPLIPQTSASAGIDLRYGGYGELTIHRSVVTRVPLGVKLWLETEMPHVGLLTIRSSLAARGIMLANGVGIIDQDYRGELVALFTNIGAPYILTPGQRVAQLVFIPRIGIQGAPAIRGEGGFGSTE